MSPRHRSMRRSRLPLKRSIRPILEDLETRLVLSQVPISVGSTVTTGDYPPGFVGPEPLLSSSGTTITQGSANRTAVDSLGGFTPQVEVYHAPGTVPSGDIPNQYGILPYDNGNATAAQSGYGPATIRAAYGVNDISFNGIVGDGAGQTIAIVDAYDNPDLVNSTAANFATSDLGVFDTEFNIPNLPSFSFTKVGQTGGAPPTATDPTGGWEAEEALDVESVHSIAPGAAIVLVEASTDLFTADAYAATIRGVSVVSNSWGGGEYSGEQINDSTFITPNVTFLYSTGDSGTPGGYPAYSPDVVAVGGTSLYTNTSDAVSYENGWSTLSVLGGEISGAGGGGTSQVEPEPQFQDGVQDTGKRTIPDVSSNANPATGVAIYDIFNGGWFQVGGTSEACPTWAAYVGIADQGRALAGEAPLTGYDQTLPALYSLPYSDFNDITVGDNSNDNPLFDDFLYGINDPGYKAKVGYDEITGLGSPKANLLVPALAGYGIADKIVVSTEPPASVVAGDSFGLTVSVEDQFGNVDTSYNQTATLTLPTNPGSSSFTPVTAAFVNGQAVFAGLSLSQVAQGYQFQVSGDGFTATSSKFNVVSNPTPQSGSIYPATSDASLRAAITSADSNNFASNTIYLEAGTYSLTNATMGQLLIEDTATGIPSKTFTIVGQGAGSTIIEPELDSGFNSRVFEVVSKSGATVTVYLKDLTIAGGYAGNGGIVGGNAALGGGLLVDGGTVSLTNVDMVDNVAEGAAGAAGGKGRKGGGVGGTGGTGDAAKGGAFYLAGGTLSLNNTEISHNFAFGGHGGSGGRGGTGFGAGGAGGKGGTASGGAGYVAGGTLSGSSNLFASNGAIGGTGGSGGTGGTGAKGAGGGIGGAGGHGGLAVGDGVFVESGSIDLGSSSFDDGWAQGGAGGYGAIEGLTKNPTTAHSLLIYLTNPGAGGSGGYAAGGGLYVSGGTVKLSGGSAATNLALGGSGGISGNLAWYLFGFTSSYAYAPSGQSDGGGIYVSGGSLTLSDFTVSRNIANEGGGLVNATSGSVSGSNVEVSGNQATYGGGILNLGTLKLDGGVVAVNSAARSGGGIYNLGYLYLTNVSVINNSAISGAGGGIYNSASVTSAGAVIFPGQVYGSNLDVSSNTAQVEGGGIYSYQGALTITGVSQIEYNTVKATGSSSSVPLGLGGGLDLSGGTEGIKISISGATISNNTAQSGGGIYVSNGKVTIAGGTISDNSAVSGGGIDANANLSLDNMTISDNIASGNGGGISDVLSLTIDNSQITGNTAGLSGGGIDSSGDLTIENSTLSDNVSVGVISGHVIEGGEGGAIYNGNSVKITDSTITLNTA
ncbi:MAG: hypothetical protein ACLQGP_15100, partial [Isosphaeraceae bacterium]